jgi:hypothetical protein
MYDVRMYDTVPRPPFGVWVVLAFWHNTTTSHKRFRVFSLVDVFASVATKYFRRLISSGRSDNAFNVRARGPEVRQRVESTESMIKYHAKPLYLTTTSKRPYIVSESRVMTNLFDTQRKS